MTLSTLRRRQRLWSVTHLATACLTCMAATNPALAQTTKAGLWEHSTTITTASGQLEQQMAQMQQQMAALPPEQRKMMDQMMAQQGVSMGGGAGGGRTSVRHCVTPEEAAQAQFPSHDENCRYTVTSRSTTTMAMTFSCQDEGKTRGEGSVTFQGDTSYQGKFVMHTLLNGKPERMNMQQSGKWLSAQCGSSGHLPKGIKGPKGP